MIGDTIVNSVLYYNAYNHKGHNGVSMFYTKENGVFLITDENNNYLRLKT